MEDISTILALEVKKELADRYFGFRKIIEDDTTSYLEEIKKTKAEVENTIGADFIRIYTILHTTDLILEFLDLANFNNKPFLCEYENQEEITSQQSFIDNKARGLTRKSRFKNALVDNYKTLEVHINSFNVTLDELSLRHKTIQEQINLFYQKNDLNGMMQFMRGLDMHGSNELTTMTGPTSQNQQSKMEQQLRISPPPPVEELLPTISNPPPVKTIIKKLHKLATKSYKKHPELDPRLFCK